jgi:ketosteroid isomerase-like protein
MNKLTILPVLLVSILTVAPTMAIAQGDPVAIIQKYFDARARGDLKAALALWADDAVIDGGGRCWKSPCVGKAAIRKRFERLAKNKAKPTLNAIYPSGNVVTTRLEVRHNLARKAGVERLITWTIYEVKGGKIVSQRTLRERTDPQTARYIKWNEERRRKRAQAGRR